MALPPRYFLTIFEVAARWECSQTEVIGWAIVDELDLVAGFPVVRFGEETTSGLMSVAGTEVRPLFRPFGEAAREVYLRQARPSGSAEWRYITEPAEGVRMTAPDIMITTGEVERFETAHGIGRGRASGPGAPAR